MIERLYTRAAALHQLGISDSAFRRLLKRVDLPRRMERNPPHGYRRVWCDSDLQALSAVRLAMVTHLGAKNAGRPVARRLSA